MAVKKDLPPIIIKKKKKGSHDAHSSAWKIALADFMTTLMCFFLVMWLTTIMNTDTSKETSKFFAGAGIDPSETGVGGLLGGQTITIDGPAAEMSAAFSALPPMGAAEENDMDTLGVYGDDESAAPPDALIGTSSFVAEQEGSTNLANQQAKQSVTRLLETLEDLEDRALANGFNLHISRTSSAIHIDMLDTYEKPMFHVGKSTLLPDARSMLADVAGKLKNIPSCQVTITGHTDPAAYQNKRYTNWELSTDRANAARRFLKNIAPTMRIDAVIGKATHDPIFAANAANRRISLAVSLPGMHREGSHERDVKQKSIAEQTHAPHTSQAARYNYTENTVLAPLQDSQQETLPTKDSQRLLPANEKHII